MRFEQLKYFIHVVDCKSFNKAAKGLFITQPALSNAIRQLEEELGLTLLTRDKKGVIPTHWGRRVYEDASAFLRNFDDTVASWKSMGAVAVGGVVPIQALPTICSYIIDSLEPLFKKAHPHISLALMEKSFVEFSQPLRNGHCRLALTAVPHCREAEMLEPLKRMGFAATPLLEDEYELFINASHPLAARDFINPDDVRDLTYLTYSSEFFASSGLFSHFQRQLRLKNIKYVNSRESMLALITANAGVTLWLGKMARSCMLAREGRIVAKKIAGGPFMPSRHYLLQQPDNLLAPEELAVAEFLRVNFAAATNA